MSGIAIEGATLRQLRREITEQFRRAGLDTPGIDARWLLEQATGLTHTDIVAEPDYCVSPETVQSLSAFVARRISGEPIDHILGYREFYGRRFKISKDVLSPRPETEGVVDIALDEIKEIKAPHVLDLGTGSGAILVSILADRAHATGVGIDVSLQALEIARQNAMTHQLMDRCTFLQGDWYAPLLNANADASHETRFDCVVSNPPYITDEDMEALDVEVRDYDPYIALRGGPDGLIAYRHIISGASAVLKPGGALILEIGYDQSEAVSALLMQAGFKAICTQSDLAGHDRIVRAVQA